MAQQVDAKKLKKVVHEGGKRGVEIEGVHATGGPSFFCTKVDEPEGDAELLVKCLEAMNAEVDEDAEERKGGSGAIGKLVFSCDDDKLNIVSYVPKDRASDCDAKEWLQVVLTPYDGKVIQTGPDFVVGQILGNPEKERYTLKMRDELIPKGYNFLVEKGLVKPSDDDSDDEFIMSGDYLDNL